MEGSHDRQGEGDPRPTCANALQGIDLSFLLCEVTFLLHLQCELSNHWCFGMQRREFCLELKIHTRSAAATASSAVLQDSYV